MKRILEKQGKALQDLIKSLGVTVTKENVLAMRGKIESFEKMEYGQRFIREYKPTPQAKLSRLRLLAMDLALYNKEYKRSAVIEGLSEELQHLQLKIEMTKSNDQHQGQIQECYSQYQKTDQCNVQENIQPTDEIV